MSEEPDSGTQPTISLAAIEQQLAARSPTVERHLEETQRLDREREAQDRSWIGRRIVWIFTGVIAVALGIFLMQGLASGQWTPVATEVSELVRSDVLPVVTLILGYYFGRSGRI